MLYKHSTASHSSDTQTIEGKKTFSTLLFKFLTKILNIQWWVSICALTPYVQLTFLFILTRGTTWYIGPSSNQILYQIERLPFSTLYLNPLRDSSVALSIDFQVQESLVLECVCFNFWKKWFWNYNFLYNRKSWR